MIFRCLEQIKTPVSNVWKMGILPLLPKYIRIGLVWKTMFYDREPGYAT